MLTVSLCHNLAKMSLPSSLSLCQRHIQMLRKHPIQKAIHTSSKLLDLNEFFDSPKNFGAEQVRVGRSWRKEELRVKSSSDLHKLWYVLLKEQNMLKTMEHECKEKFIVFPNPERIDKVQESMENLEDVIRERNVAYFQLETTHTGERPAELIDNAFGLKEVYTKSEYDVPKELNKEWQKNNPVIDNRTLAVKKFLTHSSDYIFFRSRNEEKEVAQIFATYKDVDLEAVQEKYPDVDVEEVRQSDKARGNWAP
ncbi:hypothetical protein M8J76_016462 [Diaphorina citri]|nr:hypothetical protein M8J76_016462 [Diaphorina citri]